MPLSAKVVRHRTIRMAANITFQQILDINSAPAYSIACDGSKDFCDVEEISLFCRYATSAGPKEEIIEVIPLKGQTRGVDICEAVLDCLRTKEINTAHLVSVATDGAPNMKGVQLGFVSLLQRSLNRKLLSFHCILHQEALCAQTFPPECKEVMNLVIRITNKILAQGLNHRQFRSLLDEIESIYPDLRLHNNVRWLSKGEVLKRFAVCLPHIKTFLKMKRLTFSEMDQTGWMQKLYFMVDMTGHLNTLNKSLQGKEGMALQMLEEVLAFERKMKVFATDVQKGTLHHFPFLKLFQEENKQLNNVYFPRAIVDMQTAFLQRFCDFRKEKSTLSFPINPLNVDPSLLNMTSFTDVTLPNLELADIADKDMWVSKFRSLTANLEDLASQTAILAQNRKWSDIENLVKPDKLVFDAWNAIPDSDKNMKKYAFGVLSIFGSTYVCEQSFSTMNHIKSKHRSRLTDESLQSCMKLKLSSYIPEVDKLCSEIQGQKSH